LMVGSPNCNMAVVRLSAVWSAVKQGLDVSNIEYGPVYLSFKTRGALGCTKA
jgi:hypothetical protein